MKLRDKFVEGVALGMGFGLGSAIIAWIFTLASVLT